MKMILAFTKHEETNKQWQLAKNHPLGKIVFYDVCFFYK